MSTHPAVVTVSPGGPLELHQVPTPEVTGRQVKIINQWTASTPLDLHQADGHLLVKPPQILGDGVAGTVVAVGPDVQHLRPGDQVFGFTWRSPIEKAHQLYAVADDNLLAKLPPGWTFQEGVVLGNNFVTAWHTLTKDLGFQLPWPKPHDHEPSEGNGWFLVWGGSSSVGMYTLQILKYYGYRNVIATASKAHHDRLRKYGASVCFDYREGNVVKAIQDFVAKEKGQIDYALDCIGSQDGSVRPVAQIVTTKDAKAAVLLPVIVKDAASGVRPEYEMDVEKCADWAAGVKPSGVRTHYYLDNKFLAERLQPDIMPCALVEHIVEPNDQVIVEGSSLLERAEKALSMLRDKKVSGGRLVWRVAEDDEIENALQQIRD